MTEIDRLVSDTSSVLRSTLTRLSGLARTLVLATLLVSAATYATGLWITDGPGWAIGGAVICLVPVGAALLAFVRLGRTAVVAPKAFDDLRTLFHDQRIRSALGVVIDHDSQRQIKPTVLNLGGLRAELMARKGELPALYQTIRAVTTVPGLAAIATAGLIGLGLLGTIFLVVGIVT